MACLDANQYDLRGTSSTATVPDNDLARLMYYLNCVFSAIEYKDQDIRKYRDYHNWSLLNNEEQHMVLWLAIGLSPDEFDDKVFFNSDELCGDSSNKFYEFSQVSDQLSAVQSIVLAGQTHHVKKIMTYKMSWIQYYYVEPIERFAYYLKQQREAAVSRVATARSVGPNYTYSVPISSGCVIS